MIQPNSLQEYKMKALMKKCQKLKQLSAQNYMPDEKTMIQTAST